MTTADDSAAGWGGWDAYAPFYDWENRRTMGRRDVRFWTDLARRAGGTVLELGCGTGRLSVPVARAAPRFVGLDRSEAMLRRLRARIRRARLAGRASIVRGDVRALPFRRDWRCRLVMAPYGMLQSLLSDEDLTRTLDAVAGVLARGGDVRRRRRAGPAALGGISPAGGAARAGERGRRVTLIESVRQVPEHGLTVFDQEFVEWRGRSRTAHRFSLAFRTITVPRMAERLERAGFRVDAVLGDYAGKEWSPDARVWILVARRF